MAIRQYVGARYVPRFMGVFDPTQQYEALDVVDNGAGTSYIARKIVPPGSSLIDPEYWFVYGASSGAIIQIQNDLQAVENDITNNIKPDIVQNTSNISSLQNDVIDINNKIAGSGGEIITITDSYGYHPSAAQSWQSILTTLKPDSTFYNFYEGSMGIYHVGSNGHNAKTLLEAHAGDISDPDAITTVVIALGVNDYTDSISNVSTAYDTLIEYIKTTYKNARILFGMASFSHQLTIQNKVNYKNLIGLMIAKCAENGCKYMSNIEFIMHDLRNNENDLVHPNLTGSTHIAEAVKTYLEGGNYHYIASLVSNVIANGTTHTDAMIQTIVDNVATITCSNVNNSGVLTFSGSSFIEFATISNPLFLNGAFTIFTEIFSTDANAPLAMRVTTNNRQVLLSWTKSGSHSITGCQVNSYSIAGDTLDV